MTGTGGVPADALLGIDGFTDAVEVGRGSFGVVYRAHQPARGRDVAVKVLTSSRETAAAARFDRERQVLSALSGHPAIVTVIDSGYTATGQAYVVMELMAGGSLGERIAATGPVPWPQAVEIGIGVAGGLEVAHRMGVLHRDVKPDNLLVSPYNDVKLADFGVATFVGGASSRTWSVIASVAYAAPEVLGGQRSTVASDVYGLAATSFALMFGRAPFSRSTDDSIVPMVTRILNDRVPDLRLHGIPDSVCSVLERAMARDPEQRYESAAAFGAALQEAQRATGRAVTPMVVDTNLAALPPHELVTAVPGQPTTPTPLPERPSVDAGTAAAAGAAAIGAGVGAAAAASSSAPSVESAAAPPWVPTTPSPTTSTSSPATKSGPPEPSPAILAAAAAATAGATAGGAPSGSTGTASPTTPPPPSPPPVTPAPPTPAPPASPWTPATGAATAAAAAAGAAAGATVTESRRGTWPRQGSAPTDPEGFFDAGPVLADLVTGTGTGRPSQPSNRKLLAAIAIVAIVAILGGGAVYALTRDDDSSTAAPPATTGATAAPSTEPPTTVTTEPPTTVTQAPTTVAPTTVATVAPNLPTVVLTGPRTIEDNVEQVWSSNVARAATGDWSLTGGPPINLTGTGWRPGTGFGMTAGCDAVGATYTLTLTVRGDTGNGTGSISFNVVDTDGSC